MGTSMHSRGISKWKYKEKFNQWKDEWTRERSLIEYMWWKKFRNWINENVWI